MASTFLYEKVSFQNNSVQIVSGSRTVFLSLLMSICTDIYLKLFQLNVNTFCYFVERVGKNEYTNFTQQKLTQSFGRSMNGLSVWLNIPHLPITKLMSV